MDKPTDEHQLMLTLRYWESTLTDIGGLLSPSVRVLIKFTIDCLRALLKEANNE